MFADDAGTSCNVDDLVSGLCNLYVVFVNHGGITGAQFSCPVPACMGATYMSWSCPWGVKIGDPVVGDPKSIAIGTGSCEAAPTILLTLSFFCQATTPNCCYYPVLPAEGISSGAIEGVDCAFAPTFPTGGVAVVNPTVGVCECDVPTQDTTWGRVKNLFMQ